MAFNIVKDNSAAIYDSMVLTREINWAHNLMSIPDAWTKATGRGVLVGVVDSGCDCDHRDLEGVVGGGVDCVDEDGYCTDYNGHGTSIASIISAKQSGHGVAGVAPEAKLFIAKGIDRAGVGDVDSVKCAIEACIDAGCDIVNMSIGSPEPYPEVEEIIKDAVLTKNIIFVAAAGNSGDLTVNDNDGYPLEDWPARLPYIISVAAIDKGKETPEWSSPGDIEFVAPGVDIVSCYPGDKYTRSSGTSQAASFISGVCALLKEKDKNINFKSAMEILSKYALVIGDDQTCGAGIINVGLAISAFSLFKQGGAKPKG
jgi:subtilisin family serine protease